ASSRRPGRRHRGRGARPGLAGRHGLCAAVRPARRRGARGRGAPGPPTRRCRRCRPHEDGELMLLTVGHGTLDRDGLARLLTGAGVELLVDTRRFPCCRANPAVAKGSVPELTADAGMDYRWEEQLGGRRRLTAAERRDSPDT